MKVLFKLIGKHIVKDYQQMIDELNALPSKPAIYLCTPIASTRTKVSEKWQRRRRKPSTSTSPLSVTVKRPSLADLPNDATHSSIAIARHRCRPNARPMMQLLLSA